MERTYKTIIFTRSSSTEGMENKPLNHNIEPCRSDVSYGVRYRGPRPKNDFKSTDIPYRIHKDDYPIIKELKSEYRESKKKKVDS